MHIWSNRKSVKDQTKSTGCVSVAKWNIKAGSSGNILLLRNFLFLLENFNQESLVNTSVPWALGQCILLGNEELGQTFSF